MLTTMPLLNCMLMLSSIACALCCECLANFSEMVSVRSSARRRLLSPSWSKTLVAVDAALCAGNSAGAASAVHCPTVTLAAMIILPHDLAP